MGSTIMGVIHTNENAALRIERSWKREVKPAVTATLVLEVTGEVKNGMLLKEGDNKGEYVVADESNATCVLNYMFELEDQMPEDGVTLEAGSYKVSVALSGFCRVVTQGTAAKDWTAHQRLRQFGIQAEVLEAIYA